jgi:hypothetical protein
VLRKKPRIILLYAIVLGALIGLALFTIIPARRDYYALDPEEYGQSEIAKSTTWILGLQNLGIYNSLNSLLIIARDSPLKESELSELQSFAENGGLILVYGSWSALKSILGYFGVTAEYKGRIIDPVFNTNNPDEVIVYLNTYNTSIVIYSPYAITVTETRGGVQVEPIAYSSPYSYIDEIPNNAYDVGEEINRFPVAYRILIGSGELIIFTALGVFTNNVYNYNKGFLQVLRGSREVLLDQSFCKQDPLLYFKLIINTPRGVSSIYISIIALVLMVVIYVYRATLKKH